MPNKIIQTTINYFSLYHIEHLLLLIYHEYIFSLPDSYHHNHHCDDSFLIVILYLN